MGSAAVKVKAESKTVKARPVRKAVNKVAGRKPIGKGAERKAVGGDAVGGLGAAPDPVEKVEPLDREEAIQIEELIGMADAAQSDFAPPANDAGEPVAPESSSDTSVMATQLVSVLFSVAANWRGPHWALKEGEAEILGGPLGEFIDKHAPDVNAGPEVALIFAALLIAGPRFLADKQITEESDKGKGGTNGDT